MAIRLRLNLDNAAPFVQELTAAGIQIKGLDVSMQIEITPENRAEFDRIVKETGVEVLAEEDEGNGDHYAPDGLPKSSISDPRGYWTKAGLTHSHPDDRQPGKPQLPSMR